MGFIAPVLAFVGANAGAIGAVASVVGAASSLAAATKKPKVQGGAAAAAAPPVTPLPDEGSDAVKLRLLQTRRNLRERAGAASTLVSGELGDARPPPVSAPLVLGRAA